MPQYDARHTPGCVYAHRPTARSLDDIALMRAVLIEMPHHPVDRGANAPRIGVCRTPVWDVADSTTQALIEQTAAKLSAAGARVSEVEFAAPFRDIATHHQRVFYYEAAKNYAYEHLEHRDQVSQVLLDTVLDGNPGAVLRYDGATGTPLPATGQSGAIFVPQSAILVRPIGILAVQ